MGIPHFVSVAKQQILKNSDRRAILRPSLQIGSVRVHGAAIQAPMAGITDSAFRSVALKFGAPMVVTEMVASTALIKGHKEMVQRLQHVKQTHKGALHVVQLAGKDEQGMRLGAHIATQSGADIIDINMGCPCKRVTNGLSGSALMRDLNQASRLIEATQNATHTPITVKMRLGWDEAMLNAAQLAKRAQALGVKMVTVHGRTRQQFYKGVANWSAIHEVVDEVDIPVIANGDLTCLEKLNPMLHQSGADGVMVGRGGQGRPWFVAQLAARMAGKSAPKVPTGKAFADLVEEHYTLMLHDYGMKLGVRMARKHLGWYLDGLAFDVFDKAKWRKILLTEHAPKKVIALCRDLFADHPHQDALNTPQGAV